MNKALGILAGLILLAVSWAPAHAVTFNFTDPHCTGGCGTATPYASITLTDTVQGVDIVVTPLNGNLLNFNGGGGLNTFSWSGTAGLTSVDIVGLTAGYTFLTPNPNQDGFGDFLYGINHTANGTSATGFSFTIVGWDFSDFLKSTGGGTASFFALDILGINGNTGLVGTEISGNTINPTVSEVPIPGSLVLFASGLAGLGALARRRRRKQMGAV